jgi:hypothetical protein
MTNQRRMRAVLALLAAGVFGAWPVTAGADPGEPDQDVASAGVYQTGEPGGVLGDEPGGVLGDQPGGGANGSGEPGTPGTAGEEPGGQGAPPVPVADGTSDNESSSGITSIPFTGYAALTLLGIGVGLFVIGAVLRLLGRRPRFTA